VSRDLVKVGLALAAWKADYGAYPEELDALAPDYLKALPKDRFTDQSLVYRLEGEGYRLYSLGRNMTDNGGRDIRAGTTQTDQACLESRRKWDDIVLRVPLPPPTPKFHRGAASPGPTTRPRGSMPRPGMPGPPPGMGPPPGGARTPK
jgi:hypothetical protein